MELGKFIDVSISDIHLVFSKERQYLSKQYDDAEDSLWADDREKVRDLFYEKNPSKDKYIEENIKVKTVYDAYLILKLAKEDK